MDLSQNIILKNFEFFTKKQEISLGKLWNLIESIKGDSKQHFYDSFKEATSRLNKETKKLEKTEKYFFAISNLIDKEIANLKAKNKPFVDNSQIRGSINHSIAEYKVKMKNTRKLFSEINKWGMFVY